MSAMLNPVAGDSGETWLTWRDSPAGGAWRCSRCDMDITDVDLISSYALCVNALLDRRDETLSENDRLRTELALVRKSLDDVKRICLGGLYDMTDKLTDKIGDEFSFSEA
jgi:hypothetical protein